MKPKYPVVPAGAAAAALSCNPKNEPVAEPPPANPELAPVVPNVPKPVSGAPGEPVELALVGTATFEAYAVPVVVAVATEYAVWLVPNTVNDAVLAEDAAGLNCQNLKFETVNATEFVNQGFSHNGYEAEPALTGLAVYVIVPVLSAVSKSHDIEPADDVAVVPNPAGVVALPTEPVICAKLNVAGILYITLL